METNKEKLYIWVQLPVRGYGTHTSLVVKAHTNLDAYNKAESALKQDGFSNPEVTLMLSNPPEIYYLDRFESMVINTYE
jgi:hypothetical protein